MVQSPNEFRNTGLINKYVISKRDGSEMDPNAEYFVLRVDPHEPDDPNHYHACMMALIEYAYTIEPHLPQLSKELKERYLAPYVNKENDNRPYTEGIEW